jgi:hypothetical protein
MREAAMKKEEEEKLAAKKKADEEKKAEAKKVEDKKAAEQKKLEEKKPDGAKLEKEKAEPKKETSTKKIDEKLPVNQKQENHRANALSDESNKDDIEAEDANDRAPDLKTMHMKIDPNKQAADEEGEDTSPNNKKIQDEKSEGAALRAEAESKARKHTKRGPVKREKISDIEKEAYKSFENCGEACKENPGCFQWVWYDKTCRLQTSFRLGNFQAPSDDGKVVYKSGWMVDKINEWTAENTCKEPQWP